MDQMNTDTSMGEGKICKCPHHSMVPWMIILVGVVILLGAFNILNEMWQMVLIGVFLIVIGATKLGGRTCKCCGAGKMMK